MKSPFEQWAKFTADPYGPRSFVAALVPLGLYWAYASVLHALLQGLFGPTWGTLAALLVGGATYMECSRIVARYRLWWQLFNDGMEALNS